MKALGLPVSGNKNSEDVLLCSYVQNCDPRAICTNLVKVHKEMLHTKYQSSTPSNFREKEF